MPPYGGKALVSKIELELPNNYRGQPYLKFEKDNGDTFERIPEKHRNFDPKYRGTYRYHLLKLHDWNYNQLVKLTLKLPLNKSQLPSIELKLKEAFSICGTGQYYNRSPADLKQIAKWPKRKSLRFDFFGVNKQVVFEFNNVNISPFVFAINNEYLEIKKRNNKCDMKIINAYFPPPDL